MDSLNHTFIILAYKESMYLEDCIKSLLIQKKRSNVFICTSTPNDHISRLSEVYNLQLFINPIGGSIGNDWNFALNQCRTDWLTLAHQDDIYFESFSSEVSGFFSEETSLIFTNYNHIKNEVVLNGGMLVFVKMILLMPFYISRKIELAFMKRSILCFGSPICCPSVTLNIKLLKDFKFKEEFRVSLDWEAWYRISNYSGAFVYLSRKLMAHRIHEESETTNMIRENVREQEDFYMFKKIWGKFIGKMVSKVYSLSYKFN